MSFDLYQRETADKMATLAPVQVPEAGAWDGFVRGTGLYGMQSLAKTGRAIDLAGSVGPIVTDAISGGTEAQDKYFQEHDEVFGSAVKHWTPEPNEVGVAGQTVGQLVGLLPQVLASPGLAVAGTQLGSAEDLAGEGVDATKANLAGMAQGAGLGVGIWMPVLGSNVWQRVLIGGATFNAAQGVATRAATAKILEGTPQAAQFKAFDGQALTLDVLLGAAFGSLVHLSPEARAQGASAWETLRGWAENFKPSDVDAIAALRQAQHMNVDSVPGRPLSPSDVEAHVNRLKTAIEQLERGKPVDVTDLPAGRFVTKEGEAPPGMTREQYDQWRIDELNRLNPQLDGVLHGEHVDAMDGEGAGQHETGGHNGSRIRVLKGAEPGTFTHEIRHMIDMLLGARQVSAFVKDLINNGTIGQLKEYLTSAMKAGKIDLGRFWQDLNSKGDSPEEIAQLVIDAYYRDKEGLRKTNAQLVDYLDAMGAEKYKYLNKRSDEYETQGKGQEPTATPDQQANFRGLVESAEQVRAAEGIVEPKAPDYLRTTPEMERTFEDLQSLPREEQAQGVGDVIEAQLRRIGVDPVEAQANAAIWHAFAKTAGERYGINPADVLTRYGVGVSRGTPLEGGLEQPANDSRGTVEVAGARRPIMDSTGKQLAPTTEGVRTFYRWFADSKVVDQEGKPLVVYHGTERSFDEFSQQGAGKVRGAQEGYHGPAWGEEDGFFFSESPEQASKFAIGYRGTDDAAAPNVVPAYLTLKNPMVIDFGEGSGPYGSLGKISQSEFRADMASAASKGHDGVIIHNLDDFGGRHTQYVAFKPTQIKSAVGNRGTFDAANPNILYQSTPAISAEPFYSELARQVEGAQMKQGDAKAWKDWVKSLGSKGVKADEIKWSGLEEWLDLQGGKITKDQVQEFLRNNGVKVEEVLLGDGSGEAPQRDPRNILEVRREADNTWGVYNGVGDLIADADQGHPIRDQTHAERIMRHNQMELDEELADVVYEGGPTKFATYQLPGGENYRELLLTLPQPEAKSATSTVQRVAELRREWQRLMEQPISAERNRQVNNNMTQQRLAEQEASKAPVSFQSSHFDEPNILAHVRFNERTDADGKRVLFVEEFQSDWAQRGRKVGFADPAAEQALIKKHDDAMAKTEELVNPARTAMKKSPKFVADQASYADLMLDVTYTHFADNGAEKSNRFLENQYGIASQADRDAILDYFVWTKEENEAELALAGRQKGIPTAPFVGKTEAWVALTLKRMIRYAAENGFDRIAWTKGEQQVERYTAALRKAVDAIEWKKTKDGVHIVGYKGKEPDSVAWQVIRDSLNDADRDLNNYLDEHGDPRDMDRGTRNRYDALMGRRRTLAGQLEQFGGRSKVVDTTEKEDVLSDAIGKSMAERIRNDPAQSGTIEGEAINVSDTGMASFYDRIVPNVAKDVLKKLGGGKVGQVEMTAVDGSFQVYDRNDNLYSVRDNRADAERDAGAVGGRVKAQRAGQLSQPAIDITPAMREKAMAGQPLFQGGRGQIHFGDQQTLIHLFENADRSTFVHETGHFFLNATRDLATAPNAPPAAVRDWATIANWLELDSDTIPRQAHEQFARGFEAYLMEGKAPSPMLRTVFQQFRDWLLEIYHSIADLKVALTDDIRGVMDRMLTSQSQEPAPGAPRSAPPEPTAGDGSPPPSGEGGTAPEAAGFTTMKADQPEMQGLLEQMAKQEAGWEQEGGKHLGGPAGTPNFSTWIPKSDWWAGRPDKLNAAKVQEAVRKSIAGEPLKKAEQRTVDYMTEVANKRLADTKTAMDQVKTALEGKAGEADTPETEAPDALALEAEQYVQSHPGQMVTVGAHPDGSPMQMTTAQYLEEARAVSTQARDDAKLFDVAATCLMGRS